MSDWAEDRDQQHRQREGGKLGTRKRDGLALLPLRTPQGPGSCSTSTVQARYLLCSGPVRCFQSAQGSLRQGTFVNAVMLEGTETIWTRKEA